MTTHAEGQVSAGHVTLAVEGMTCGSCVRAVERALTKVTGVDRAVVDLSSGRAHIEGTAQPNTLISAVRSAGYKARIVEGPDPDNVASNPPRVKGCC